jgi:hypothetical protein
MLVHAQLDRAAQQHGWLDRWRLAAAWLDGTLLVRGLAGGGSMARWHTAGERARGRWQHARWHTAGERARGRWQHALARIPCPRTNSEHASHAYHSHAHHARAAAHARCMLAVARSRVAWCVRVGRPMRQRSVASVGRGARASRARRSRCSPRWRSPRTAATQSRWTSPRSSCRWACSSRASGGRPTAGRGP